MRSPLLRQAFLLALAAQPSIVPIGSVGRPADLDHVLRDLRPEVLLLDAAMAGSGLERLADIASRAPGCRSVLLLDRPSVALARKARAQHALVIGYDSSLECLVQSVRAAALLVGDEPNWHDDGATKETIRDPLREREIDVLRLTAAGHEPREIARSLRLSTGTVRNYLTSAVSRLGARNRIDAIRIAEEHGLLLVAIPEQRRPAETSAPPKERSTPVAVHCSSEVRALTARPHR